MKSKIYKMKPFVEYDNLKKVGYYNSVWYRIERYFDKHNHLMEFIRTLLALIVLGLQLFIITKLI